MSNGLCLVVNDGRKVSYIAHPVICC